VANTLPLSRRLLSAATWPAGVALTSWDYLWRTTPIRRANEGGSAPDDLPPELPAELSSDGVQHVEHGVGPLFHRTYRVAIQEAECDARALITRLSEDPNHAAPVTFASFQKTEGEEWHLRVEDEFVVRMPGPWDGPIRVVDVTPTSFRFVTLDGHLEAGQIEWSAADEDHHLTFQIESWARSGDRLSAIMHDRLRMAKEVQLHMWIAVTEKVIGLSGGRRASMIEMHTRRVPADQLPG
jgi:Domain of unknown function (DUF1990)